MKRIELVKLSLRNFKGMKDFTLELNGESATVYGDNATGKTTLFDAFTWVLFDKDSGNKSQFDIKTLDTDNKPIHGLEHEVEATLRVDGKQVTLRKVYSEKWTKRRGAAKAEFTGHTTDYFINGVPSKKKEYTDQVAEIVDEEAFKLITNPAYFNEVLGWKERREILLEVCGDVSDSEVIASKEDLSTLLDVLQGRSIEEHRRIIAARRTEINKELDRIPTRIDEVQRNKPELPEHGIDYYERRIANIKKDISEKEASIQGILTGGEISAKEKRINELNSELLQMKNELNKAIYDEIEEKRKELSGINAKIDSMQYEITRIDRAIEYNDQQVKALEAEMQTLREKWSEVNSREFLHEQETVCPTCKQELPEEEVQTAQAKALERFNIEKSAELERISNKGKAKKEEVEKLNAERKRLVKDKDGFLASIDELKLESRKVEVKIGKLEKSVTDVTETIEYRGKKKQIEALQDEIRSIRESQQESIAVVQSEIDKLKDERDRLEQEKLKFAEVKKLDKRLEELSEQERQLAAEFERLEHELYMTEEFIRTKVSMLEDRINSKFKHARFKLFDVQVNGALNEVCETTYKGVPYSTGLNNAMKINVGLDIINTLSEHYGFRAPIFIDNAEAVTKLIETNAQVIRLVVSEQDKQLRVEVAEEKQLQEVV